MLREEGGGSDRHSSSSPSPPPPTSKSKSKSTATTTSSSSNSRRSPRLTIDAISSSAILPTSELFEFPNLISEYEASSLVRAIDGQVHGGVWRPEGYDRRHRVQRYPSSSSSLEEERGEEEEEEEQEEEQQGEEKEGQQEGADIDGWGDRRRARGSTTSSSSSAMEDAFGWIFDRIVHRASSSHSSYSSPPPPSLLLAHRPYEVVVIEHTMSSCRSAVRTFEQNELCPCRRDDGGGGGGGYAHARCDCYVAHLTLLNSAVVSIERPATRDPECWDLVAASDTRSTSECGEAKYTMEKNGVVVRGGRCLWDWRGCVSEILDGGGADAAASEGGGDDDDDDDDDGGVPTARAVDGGMMTTTTTTTTERKVARGKGKPWTRTAKLNASGRRCITIAFRGIRPPLRRGGVSYDVSSSSQGRLDTNIADAPGGRMRPPPPPLPLPPLSTLLTIVVTTSPIRSHPSTELLERTFGTFHFAGEEFAYECPKVIVCDGCRVLEEEGGDANDGDAREEKKDENTTTTTGGGPRRITQKYANTKQNLRNGIATTDQARRYGEFKSRLRELCDGANADDDDRADGDHDPDDPPSPGGTATSVRNRRRRRRSPFRNARVVELEERHGYGFALRHALRHHVSTPYVCVIQHDRTFMRPAPAKEVVAAMSNDPEGRIKYVGMSMRSNIMYHDIFSGKYGRRAAEEFKTMILRPPELRIGGGVYGPDGTSVGDMVPPGSEKRRVLLDELRKTYRLSHQCITQDEWLRSRGPERERRRMEEGKEDGYHQLTLTPVLFWYDNTHIAETAHYRDFVFHPHYKMVARGGFVEDKLSPCLVRSCERLGLKEGHSKFGCYVLDDHGGAVFTGHLDGGSYMTGDLHVNNSDK